MTKVYLHDGRLIDPDNFSVMDTQYRRFTAADKWAMRWGWEAIQGKPDYSIAISRRNGVVAKVIGAASKEAAYIEARGLLDAKVRYHTQAPKTHLIATVGFRPGTNDAVELMRMSDGIFAPEGLEIVEPFTEMDFLRQWFGPGIRYGNGKSEMYRRVLVRRHWNRMDKIYGKLKSSD